MRDYRTFKRQLTHMSDYPQVRRVVDVRHGVVYINVDAAADAKLIWLLPA